MRNHQLLVIDFDYFFPNPLDGGEVKGRNDLLLYDWGHSETPFFQDTVWSMRAIGFVRNSVPLPGLSGEQEGFWKRFTFAPRTKLFYADSNAYAVSREILGPRTRYDSVWLYDAHHDAGYFDIGASARRIKVAELIRKREFSCDYWMIAYSVMDASLHLRYPRWKVDAFNIECEPLVPMDRQIDDGSSPNVSFDRVFVCRSGGWVPPWNDLDLSFQAFVDAAPIRSKTAIEPVPPREFDLEMVQQSAEQETRALADFFARQAEISA